MNSPVILDYFESKYLLVSFEIDNELIEYVVSIFHEDLCTKNFQFNFKVNKYFFEKFIL